MKNLFLLSTTDWIEKPRELGARAPETLAALQTLWHPSFLADAEELPSRRDVDNLPRAEELVIAVLRSDLEAAGQIIQKDFAELPGIKIVVEAKDVGFEAPQRLLEPFGLPCMEEPLLFDFFALGYAYHSLDVLFEQMGHDNPLSQDAVYVTIQEAAGALLEGNHDECRAQLRNAFEILSSARSMVYPATISIVDLGLAYPGVTVEAIRGRSQSDAPINLILTGCELEEIAGQTATGDPIFAATHGSKLEVLSGVYDHRPLGLLPLESRLWQLAKCMDTFEKHVGSTPSVFAARGNALLADLPQLLMKFQYRYALHAAFDGSKLPHFRSPKLHWTARDGSVIEALSRVAMNAGDPNAAFAIFAELGRTTMSDRSATLVLAHWIGQGAPWYEYLLRIHEHANVFGHFHTFDDFFMSSSMPDRPTTTQVEEYSTDALSMLVRREEADPISRWQNHYGLRGRLDNARNLAAMLAIAGGPVTDDMTELEDAVEMSHPEAGAKVEALTQSAAAKLESMILTEHSSSEGFLIFNPCGFARRLCVELPGSAERLHVEHPVRAVQSLGSKTAVVVDAPAFGYTWIARKDGSTPPDKKEAPLATGRRLRNEFLEVEIDGKTGGIRGLWDVRDRYSRLGQQLAFGPSGKAVCQKLQITSQGPAFGEIVTEGEIRDPLAKQLLAKFRQSVRLWIGRPVVEIAIHLEPAQLPSGNPPDDAITCRWAWPDEKTIVSAASGFALEPVHGAQIESPQLVQIRERNLITDILTHGVPFHHRSGFRVLDSILVAKGESCRDFHFTVGLNLAHPWSNVCDAFQPPIVRPIHGRAPANPMGWFARVTDSNVCCFSMVPFEEQMRGVRLRLIETAGKATHTELRFAQRPSVAELTDCRGQLIFGLHPSEEGLAVDFSPYELLQINVIL